MEKYFGEKQERFSFRKLSVGLVSATISSLFFMSVLASSSVDAQETAGVHYKYVADSELSSEEKKQLVYDIPTYVENDDETYYLVYKLNSQNQLAELPNTGSKNERQALVAGASLAALGILIFAVSKKKVKNKTVLHLVLVAGIGNGVLVSVHALENHLLLNYNTDYELTSGEKLPLPKEISGYTYIGYIKEGKTTSDFEVSNQEKSAATPTKQQKVDYNVTPNFVDHPSTVQAIQEQTPVSSTKPTEVQVVEKPFSTELINPRKEEKQSSDSQEQLAEHKNLETKKEEKISPKEKTGVNTLNPQDEVLSGQLNKPELLYREETIETKIDFQEEIQENPDLAEGTVRVKQEGKLGKKVEIVRIFSVNKEEVSREIVSTSTTAPIPRIAEKGTKKTQVIKEQPETGVEHKDVQSGAIVEPAIQPELPEAVVSDKGEPEQVAPLPEYKGNIEQVKPETPVEKTKEQGPEKTEEVPVKPTEETPVNPNEGTTEGTSIQGAENPVQPAEESTTNSEKVSPDTSSENTGEVSSNPSDSITSVGESNKPENSGNTTSENGQTEPEPSNGNSTEDVSTESNTSNSNGNEEIKQENELDPDKKVEEPEKTLELRNVSEIELYSVTDNVYKQQVFLEKLPSNIDRFFVKVKSTTIKDVYLPVESIVEETKDGKQVYKITAKAEKLQQELENKYTNNFTFYLDKKKTEEKTNFTSFSNLVNAINQNLAGTYHLAASLNANEVELGTDDKSYIKGTFTGQLIGEKDGKHYAIYNLKKPLFESLRGATIEKLSLKNVSISGKDDIGSLANEAKNGTTINEVHVDGLLGGERGIGGLVAKVDQSSITESSFKGRIVNTYETTTSYNICGLIGHLTGSKASLTKSKATVAISSNTNSSDQTIGGLAGLVDQDAHIQDSYAEGDINNVKHFGRVAGVAGNLWDRTSGEEQHAGILTNVLSDVNVTNGNAITGYHYKGMKVTNTFSSKANRVFNVTLEKDEVVSKESFEERGTMLDASQIASKKAEINLITPPIVEPLSTSGKKDSDFSKIAHYQANRALVYKNIEKLLPFYNKATIVKYGNLVKENSILYQKELLSAVMMKDDQVITDIISNKQTANKLLLHYKDDLSEKLDLKYQNDFAKLAEYSLGNTGLLYTPNQFLYDQTSIIKQVLPDLQKVDYHSEAIRKTLGISPNVKQTELYLEDQFAKTKQQLEDSLKKLLSADAGLASANPVTEGYLVDKIKRNKEALLLGLTYLERWYNFSYGQVNVKDLVMYHPDFFGKGNTSPLDTLIELGKSGFNNLLAKNNVDTYAISLASHHGTTDLFSTLENYRKVFLPDKTNNDWFKSQTKAYIAKGLLQAPDQPSDATITINSILKHSKSDSKEGERLQVLDPTTRFKDATDLQKYVHNMFDVVYMLEYLEGKSIVKKLNVYQKIEALRKIENQYLTDPADGNDVYATNVVKNLTEDEAKKLTSFDSLIDNNILSAREYKAGTYERNGYFTIKLFAPIFSALSGEKGTPGDLMGRRIAFELLAAKGFKDGMVPYISNQYEEDAKQQGQTINLYGKERGLVTDELVLKKVFDGKYKTWAEFKTAMYQERVDQFGNLKQVTFKDPTKPWPRYGTKTINNVDELQKLMDEAVLQDATGTRWSNYNPETDSAVHKLKRAIFKAYLDQTNDFRSSIFENKNSVYY